MEQKIDIKDLKHVLNEDIKRCNFYWAAVSFTEERPFYVFKTIKNAQFIGKKKEENQVTFDGNFSETKHKNESEIIDIIVSTKED